MIETDIPVFVLTCFRVGFEGQKLVKNKLKIAHFDPKITKYSKLVPFLLYQDLSNDYIWLHMIETDMSVCVLICFNIYSDLQCHNCQKYAKNSQFCIYVLNI